MGGVSQINFSSALSGKIQRLPLVLIGIDIDTADPIVGFNLNYLEQTR